jgi:hypothetical protein
MPAAWAQGVHDPTRPPQELLGAAKPPPSADADKKADAALAPGVAPVQLLLVGPTRRFAIIRGQLYDVGPKSKDARLVEVHPDEIVIRTSEGSENLRLYPDVEKQVAKPRDTRPKSAPAKEAKDKK